jgi:hypothetical protein
VEWGGDFLGTLRLGRRAPTEGWRPFEEARKHARGLKLRSAKEWYAYAGSGEGPPDIPYSVERVYADAGWVSWGDFLGTTNKYKGERRRLEEA